MFQGMVLNFISLNNDLKDIILFNGLKDCETVDELYDSFKRLSNSLKKVQNILRDDLTMIFEFEVLTNRIDGKVDTKKEMENRINPKLVELPSNVVYMRARRIFENGKRQKNIQKRNINFRGE